MSKKEPVNDKGKVKEAVNNIISRKIIWQKQLSRPRKKYCRAH